MTDHHAGPPEQPLYRQLTIEEAIQAIRVADFLARHSNKTLTLDQAYELVMRFGVCTACGWVVDNSEINRSPLQCPRCMHKVTHRMRTGKNGRDTA